MRKVFERHDARGTPARQVSDFLKENIERSIMKHNTPARNNHPVNMKKCFYIFIFLCSLTLTGVAQDFGLSFSYFLPKNGYFSTPISPFSIRGLGFNLNRFIAVQTGASLYRMSGLNLKDLPFESKAPLIGPNFTILVPVELVFELKGSVVEFDVKAGGFAFYGFDQRLNYGNLDRAIRAAESWQVANSAFSFDNNPGFGYHGGVELTVYVTSQVGVSLETNYYVGEAKFPLSGSYTGGNATIETIAANYDESRIDFTGLEFAIGLIFSSGNAKPPSRKKR